MATIIPFLFVKGDNVYVDAIYKKESDKILVVERHNNGERVYKEYDATYQYFYPDNKGKYKSISNEPLSRAAFKTRDEFKKEIAIKKHSNIKLYESDLDPVFVCLSDVYNNAELPKLNIAFWDIETDMDTDVGFSTPEDASMPITAISVHLQWLDTLITMAIPPKTLEFDDAIELIKDIPNTVLFKKESELLDYFLHVIDDADVLSAWNGTGYDIPYTCNRIIKILSKKSLSRMCLWDKQPKKREYEKYGKTNFTYDLVGRVNLDYMELYQKFVPEERSSYRLDYIGEYEVGENKVEYEGTLDQLYNNDFKKFILYNRQDTALLNKIDKKLKYIERANVMAHGNTVLLPSTLGTVISTEQAIINEAHSLGLRVPDRNKDKSEDSQAAGAYVAYPVKGMHDWVGSLDINSLYPSAIRALNMSPETIVGQLRPTYTDALIHRKMVDEKTSFAEAWEGLFGSLEYEYVMNKESDKIITVDWTDGKSNELPANDVYALIFESKNKLMLSANGTIFSYNREGVIPGLLAKWYADRKRMQKTMKQFQSLQSGIKLPDRLL
jgi:DNA polymerase elongation subunit (family B)